MTQSVDPAVRNIEISKSADPSGAITLPSAKLVLLVASAIAFFMFGLTSSIIGPTIVDLAAAIGVSIAAAGILRSGRQLGQLVGFLLFGKAADQYDLRWLALFGGAAMGLGLLMLTSNGLAIAVCATLIWGLGHSTYNLAPNVIIGRVFKAQAPAIMTSLHGVYGIGAIAGPWYVELLRPQGVQMIYGISAAMCAMAGLIYWIVTRGTTENSPARHSKELGSSASLDLRTLLPFLLGVLLFSGANFTASDWLYYYTNYVVGAGALSGTIVTSAFWLAMTGGRFLLGLATARMGEQGVLRMSSLCAVVGAVALAMPTASIGLITISAALLGLGLAPTYPILIASAANLFPESRGRVTGMLAAAGAFGAVILPLLQGWLAAREGLGLVVVLFATSAMTMAVWTVPTKATKPSSERPL